MKRICLLTGASGLLGTAFIRRYGDYYQIIAIHNRRQVDTRDEVFIDPLFPSKQIKASQHSIFPIQADITRRDEIDRIIREVIHRFGNIDLLINGAAISNWSHALSPTAANTAEAVLQTNLLAPFWLSVAVVQKLWRKDPEANRAKNRNIINISSTAGLYVYPNFGQALYGTSKAALNHLTRHLASDFQDVGIRVNAIAPNSFPGRITTERVLDAIVNLDGSTETGQVLPLDESSTSQAAHQ